MIEKVNTFSFNQEDILVPMIEDGDFKLNHVVLPGKHAFPAHPTDALVTIIVLRGRLQVALGDQQPVIYDAGHVIVVPKGTMSGLSNPDEAKTEVFVIKR